MPFSAEGARSRDTQRLYRINVIGGCGHVGLPLALALADKGHQICVHDIDERAIATIRSGKMPFREANAEPLLKRVLSDRRFEMTTDPASISQCEIAIFIIGTPVDEHLNPKFGVIKETLDSLFPHFRDGQILILRSTVFPGISEKVQSYFDDRGKKVSVCFCPERIAEGEALHEYASLPQIVSGFSPEAAATAASVFAGLTAEIITLAPLEAELTKLFTNAYRYIKFSIANQFYQIANDYGIDFYKIHHAMTYNYPRAKDFPTPGFAAGPCLFKDTMQLAAFNNGNFFLGHAAMLINEGLPTYIVSKLKLQYPLRQERVGILGMAFKANSDDKRESLSYKLKKILEIEAKQVLCSDVYLKDDGFVSTEELVQRCDIIVLGVPHREYKGLDFKDKHVVDVWNFYNRGGLIQ